MKEVKKAIAGSVTALAAVIASYLVTGELDQAGVEEVILAIVAAGIGYYSVWKVRNQTKRDERVYR